MCNYYNPDLTDRENDYDCNQPYRDCRKCPFYSKTEGDEEEKEIEIDVYK